jgi:Permuted papain-like amidase enzyme, YaeF/YiiX, C92 family
MTISETVFTDGSVPAMAYDRFRPLARDGDIMLCSGSAVFSTLIQKATGSIFSHVGFVMWLRSIDRLMVLESVESIGVRTVPISNYLSDYSGSGKPYPGRVLIARHDDVAGAPPSPDFSRYAIDRFGYPYDKDEIIRIAAHIAGRGLLAGGNLQDAREYICSEYAAACFRSLGIAIRQQDPGFVAPSDFAADPKINGVAVVL